MLTLLRRNTVDESRWLYVDATRHESHIISPACRRQIRFPLDEMKDTTHVNEQ